MTLHDLSDDEYDRVGRYVAGDMSASERADFEAWCVADPVRRTVVDDVHHAWNDSSAAPSANELEVALYKLKVRIGLERYDRVLVIGSKSGWWRDSGLILRLAAAALLVVGTAVVWRRVTDGPEATSTVAATDVSTFTTGVGERRSVRLPDGSTVELGVASTLTLAPDYGQPARGVELLGEAFFRVEHDALRPFKVRVKGTTVEDLGTEFSIRAYSEDSTAVVAVESGSVSVQAQAASPIVLRPHDVATVRGDSAVAVLRDVDISPYLAFRDGRLVFDNAPLSRVFPELERWYDVEFHLTDQQLLSRRVTVTFDSMPLDEVLDVIERQFQIQFARPGGGRVIELAPPARTGMTAGAREQVGGGA